MVILPIVPLVAPLTDSTSPAKPPDVTATVALASVALSGSLTAAAPDSVTAPAFSVNDTLAAVPASVGASLIAVMLTVVVAVVVALLALPSLSVHTTVRVGAEPKSVG